MCGREACDHCMMPLFKLESFCPHTKALVQVCSESCGENFSQEIKAIIGNNIREEMSAGEKPAIGGAFLQRQLAQAYLIFAVGNPKYPPVERREHIESMMRSKGAEYHKPMQVEWFYNYESRNEIGVRSYKLVFPEQAVRAYVHGPNYKVCYDSENPGHQDGSVHLFMDLLLFMEKKCEELGGPTADEAHGALVKHAEEVRARHAQEERERRERERLKNMTWYELRAKRGICDWCNEELKVRGGVSYCHCHFGCQQVFCSVRCYAEHLEHVHGK